MAAQPDGKWRGSASEVIPAPVDKVWVVAEFDGLHRNFPFAFSSSEIVEGENNKVGAVRALVAPLPTGLNLECKERLLHYDALKYTTTYSMEENNLGWTGYVGQVSATSTEDGQTLVTWRFEINPISGLTEEEYITPQSGFFKGLLGHLKASLRT